MSSERLQGIDHPQTIQDYVSLCVDLQLEDTYLEESIKSHQTDVFSGSDSSGSVLLRWRLPLHSPKAAVSSQIPHPDREWRGPPTNHSTGRK